MRAETEAVIEAGPDNNPVPTAEVQRFVEDIRKVIEANLPVAPRKASLMPYRYGCGQLLGLDWTDSADNLFAVTFHIKESPSLPSAEGIGSSSVDVGVIDMTDALLLARFVVQTVNGNAIAEL